MQDGYLVRFVATGAAIGAMAGLLFGDSALGPLWGLVIGTLSVFAWAWTRRLGDETTPAPGAGESPRDGGSPASGDGGGDAPGQAKAVLPGA